MKDRVPTLSQSYLYLLVFTSGLTTLAVELTASRLLGSVFGTSNIVWANVIGLMLLYLTVGYFVGGRLADRSPHPQTLLRIVLWAAFLSALIPLIARPILRAAGAAFVGLDAALVLGSFASVLILFAVPVTLLGTVSPFVIKLAVKSVDDAGRISGQIYAVGTLGSLVGTFIPVLVLTPAVGTTLTFIVVAGLLFAVVLWGWWRLHGLSAFRWLWMPAVVAALFALVSGGPLRAAQDDATLLYETESAYNYIQVQEDARGYRRLYLNEGQGTHSIWHPERIYFRGTWDFFLTAPYFYPPGASDVESLLVIGLAAGTIAQQYQFVYGDIPMDGVEIDPAVIEAGERFFDMDAEHLPSLTTYAQDGRYVLSQLERQYSVIGIDAYKPPYIPWHMTTVEFFTEVRQHLQDDGAMVINVGRTSTDRRLVNALANTLSHVYPSVHALDVPFSFNTILVATVQPTQSANLAANLEALPEDANPLLREVLREGVASLTSVQPNDILFTDDRAPVENLVDSLVLNFLLEGGTEELR